MCGEHISTVGCHDVKAGSSPHVRGARGLLLPRGIVLGIIPACAGSTSYLAAIFHLPRDHPRMCGENRNIIACICVSLGSSPHVRGAQKHCRHRRGVPGIIPACAGSTIRFYPECGGNGDHPRMCGEHSLSINHAGTPVGSSPHVRGAPLRKRGAVGIRRIIPACAGSTCWWRCCCPCWWDHPRMCGEHTAGVALCLRQKRDHPRMCGEHTYTADDVVHSKGSSPHVRGAHFENSIIPRKRKDNWLFFIQFRFENFLAFRYLLALLHPFLGVPTKDPSFASLGRLINCNPSQSTGDQSAPYTLKAICCSFLAE